MIQFSLITKKNLGLAYDLTYSLAAFPSHKVMTAAKLFITEKPAFTWRLRIIAINGLLHQVNSPKTFYKAQFAA